MNVSLGGPGVACSAMRVRRLLAGELAGGERGKAEEHLRACARCQATRLEIEAEGGTLAEVLPFERFAAGVAEGLTRPERAVRRRLVPLALAAGLALVAAVPLVAGLSGPVPGDGVRTKGGASMALFVLEGGSPRALAPGRPVPGGALLRASIQPGAWSHAALVLADADGSAVLYAGPARAGPLAEAFEWTGEGAEGTLSLVLADAPIAVADLQGRLARGTGAAPPSGASEVLSLPLRRGVGR